MLIRCTRCHALFSLQDGLGGGQRTFQVECGRCLTVFEAQRAQLSEPPARVARRTPTPPVQKAIPAALAVAPDAAPAAEPPSPALAAERHATPAELAALTRGHRTAIFGPVARRNPLTRGGAIAVAVLTVAAVAVIFALNRPRMSHEYARQARAALLLDDDESLAQAASLYAEAAKAAKAKAPFEADRAFALLLRASARQDRVERLEPLARTDPVMTSEREAHLRAATRLLQEGAAAAKASLDVAPDDLACLRAAALASALSSGNPQQYLEAAARKAPGDALLAYARAAAALAGGPTGDAYDRAWSALAAARQAEPQFLRAELDAAVLALERRDLAGARTAVEKVLEANPRHERAKRILSSVAP
jgi:cbb3-type cytochrome oxidase subunit 3